LTAAEAAERDAKQRDKQKEKDSEATASLPSDPSPFAPFFAPPSIMLALKPRGRLKGSKNQTFAVSIAFDEPSFSFVSTVMTRTTKSGRAVKETIVWKQESQPRRRPRGSTLEIVAPKSVRKKSKPNLMAAATLNESESQQKRLIESAFVIE